VFHSVHFRHFGKLKMRFVLNPTFVNVVNVLDIFVLGLEKSTKPRSFPILLLLKKLIFKNCIYIYMQTIHCMSDAVSTLHVQLR